MSTNNKESELKRRLLGDAPAITNGVMHSTTPNQDELREPLTEGHVIYGFCDNCGAYTEFPMKSLEELAKIGKFEIPKHPSDYFLRINSCATCKKEVRPEVSIEAIG